MRIKKQTLTFVTNILKTLKFMVFQVVNVNVTQYTLCYIRKGKKMGLSSSQARLLNLTARMHQIEYKAQKLEAMKLQMANESSQVYEEYQEALEKTKVQVKSINTDGSLTYKDISSYADLKNAGYYLYYQAGDGSTWQEFQENQNCDLSSGEKIKISKLTPSVLSNLLNSGLFLLTQYGNGGDHDDSETDYENFLESFTSVSTNTGLQEVSDESALRKAEAKYEADMKKIDNKDKKYDTDLAALETERTAIKEEMETLKTVAKENVERTFKLFS